jgi:hypothetical protein
MIYLGIDPGVSGAIAVIWDTGQVSLYDLSPHIAMNAQAVREILTTAAVENMQVRATIEQVNAMPSTDGKRSMGATSAFNFGKTVGALHGILAALEVPYETVTPQKWRGAMIGGGRGLERSGRKALSRETALRLYPDAAPMLKRVKDADRAEALLIARYGQLHVWR